MNAQKSGGWRENARKVAIVLVLVGSFWPPLAMNIAIYSGQAGLSGPITRLNQQYFPSFHALLLCQMWGLFAYISPFNYTLNYEVELSDGRVVALHDYKKEAAGKWATILFHNEPKTDNNFYANHSALKQYLEYLIRTNGVDSASIARRTIFIRYRNVFPRGQAAKTGTYYGPETTSVIENY
jgi:hypothetical protein